MARVPARVPIAITDDNDQVVEIVNFDRTYDLKRNCRRMVDISAHPEIVVGWTIRDGGFWPPAKAGD